MASYLTFYSIGILVGATAVEQCRDYQKWRITITAGGSIRHVTFAKKRIVLRVLHHSVIHFKVCAYLTFFSHAKYIQDNFGESQLLTTMFSRGLLLR